MVARSGTIVLGCFLEDIAQEKFVTAMVRKVAADVNVLSELRIDVQNSAGGASRALGSLRNFLSRFHDSESISYDCLVVSIDGDCKTYQNRRTQITRIATQSGYTFPIVCAIPDPYIEKWYLADPVGFQQCFSSSQLPIVPTYKCESTRYKSALANALKNGGLDPLLGGPEYGDEIVDCMDLYRAEQNDPALGRFLRDMRAEFARIGQH